MKDYREGAEEMWHELAMLGAKYRPLTEPTTQELLQKRADILAAALQDAYRAGIAAMQERFAREWTPGMVYSAETARRFVETCAELVLEEARG